MEIQLHIRLSGAMILIKLFQHLMTVIKRFLFLKRNILLTIHKIFQVFLEVEHINYFKILKVNTMAVRLFAHRICFI